MSHTIESRNGSSDVTTTFDIEPVALTNGTAVDQLKSKLASMGVKFGGLMKIKTEQKTWCHEVWSLVNDGWWRKGRPLANDH